jgi:hypothetical protein
MSKTFQNPTIRKPRSAESDPAGKEAAKSFGFLANRSTDEEALSNIQTTNIQSASLTERDEINSLRQDAIASIPTVTVHAETNTLSESVIKKSPGPLPKMTIYPSSNADERLAFIRARYRIGASMIAEHALELFLASHSDEEIADIMRTHGHGLRRAKNIGREEIPKH